MKSIKTRNKKIIFAAATGLLSIAAGGTNAYADSNMVRSLTGFDINETQLLKGNSVVVGGWANAGITYNAQARLIISTVR